MLNQNNRINVEITDQIAHVKLAHPNKHNALDILMFESIVKTIKALKKNRSIRAVILSAEGPDFCTGLDVKSMMKSAKGPLKLLLKLNPWSLNLAQKVSTHWQNIGVPVIAAVKKLFNKSWFGSKGTALMRESYYQLRIIFGKNSKIKTHNQTHKADEHKIFIDRKKW